MPLEKNIFKDDHTERRIHEHLANEKDIISEEDISNVKTNIVSPGSLIAPSGAEKDGLPGDDKKEPAADKKAGAPDDPGIETPWNLLK